MLQEIADFLVYQGLGLQPDSTLGGAVNFFVYDSMKIFLMLTIIIFMVSILRSYFPAERTKKILSHKREFFGNVAAAALGVVTPFCSCSAVPVFIGFIESGVPLGITFSFLIASPMVNEVAVIMLWGLLGWEIMLIYIVSGLLIAIIGGWVIGKLKLERFVQDYVYEMKLGEMDIIEQTFRSESTMPGIIPRKFCAKYSCTLLRQLPWGALFMAMRRRIFWCSMQGGIIFWQSHWRF